MRQHFSSLDGATFSDWLFSFSFFFLLLFFLFYLKQKTSRKHGVGLGTALGTGHSAYCTTFRSTYTIRRGSGFWWGTPPLSLLTLFPGFFFSYVFGISFGHGREMRQILHTGHDTRRFSFWMRNTGRPGVPLPSAGSLAGALDFCQVLFAFCFLFLPSLFSSTFSLSQLVKSVLAFYCHLNLQSVSARLFIANHLPLHINPCAGSSMSRHSA